MPSKSSVIIDLKFIPEEVAAALKGAFPDREVINRADAIHDNRDLSDIDYAVVWKSAPDLFERAPDLKVVFSGGAGVDHVLTLPGLPDVPLVRFVDRSLTTRMSEWVVMQCLMHLRQHSTYEALAAKREWRDLSQPEAADITVGIMGMGVLGQDAARKLSALGFKVVGWSRSTKAIDGIETYGGDELDAFLARTDFLVGLLPLTPETRGIFNAGLFAKLSRNGPFGAPVFINGGRGGSQVETDILSSLDSGLLGAASLDVFEQEPLSPESRFWQMPNVYVTPHVAASSDVKALFRHVEQQIARLESGQPLQHVVDKLAGY
ncbi:MULTISPECIES: glyoxylate/hydroxypyruvate reductase A [Ensifer]|jgi:glyoxylate/hydroxypyruvate reductase A|uniref:Glyoxylate/hydroxypyruvate reductase A n=1 Tax=Ensifer canadensis TaxID=555315 RepID=A0AAW4FCE2_9HYPH|nr:MULTISPECIES: glyoxylate/hydroxypyruvate reductase A [Ensifer]AHK42944.1 putative 2-hydroxyacid dehydrogenase protein [Ensifer adhaerens OV14]MDP9628972.1 glyoxylate/hydroxypyruvate reductase A [Ensifer adhaerens]KQU98563.1 glyoxylate/hydroxypyruvate reductase A [Ensifer sp. Root31]KQW63323.1 glyoxylate/hydroxypyruvate reductase A [Ensifer sp. Root1252]KQW85337.1 glyoxylate/hydroxypyruvate reductase A [Ensifer sp. Root127]